MSCDPYGNEQTVNAFEATLLKTRSSQQNRSKN